MYLIVAFLGYLSTFVIDIRKQEFIECQDLLKMVKIEREAYKSEKDSLIYMLQQSFFVVNSQQSSPFAFWQKSKNGVMMSLNDVYVDIFLKPRNIAKYQYLGYTDYDVWPKKIADEFTRNDKWVIENGKKWQGYETVIVNGNITQWRIIKWPIWNEKMTEIVGVAGLAMPEEWIETTFIID